MDVVESKWYEMDMSLNDVKNLLSGKYQNHVQKLYCCRILYEIYPGP